MGGLIIIASIVMPVILLANLTNVYVLLLVFSTLWLGAIGFIDDYIKVFRKDKKGLHGKFKILGQVGLGIMVGSMLYFNDSVVIREDVFPDFQYVTTNELLELDALIPTKDAAVKRDCEVNQNYNTFFQG
jgi:phospho-N-acetylmuramoyl-pentapeptide-transferase